MKALKIYLMIMGGLLTLALFAGIVVWYLYQDLPGANPRTRILNPESDEVRANTGDVPLVKTESGAESTTDTLENAPVYTITSESLTESQRAVLATFGMSDSSFAVTEGMITCTKDAVGVVRFEEILNGSAPGPLEAMAILPCMKR